MDGDNKLDENVIYLEGEDATYDEYLIQQCDEQVDCPDGERRCIICRGWTRKQSYPLCVKCWYRWCRGKHYREWPGWLREQVELDKAERRRKKDRFATEETVATDKCPKDQGEGLAEHFERTIERRGSNVFREVYGPPERHLLRQDMRRQRSEIIKVAQELIQELPPMERQCVTLAIEHTQREIADRLGVSRSTVKTHIERARAKIIAQLQDLVPGELWETGEYNKSLINLFI